MPLKQPGIDSEQWTNHIRAWESSLGPDQADLALSVARSVATRLSQRDSVEAAVLAAERQTAFPKSVHWQSSSVAQGFAGLALMQAYFGTCFPGEGWDQLAHYYLQLATWDADALANSHPGMFSGLGGLAFVTDALAQRNNRYISVRAALEAAVLQATSRLVRDLTERPAHGASVGAFDVISGLSGIGAYLLSRREEPGVVAVLQDVLRALIALTGEDDGLPRWYTPAHLVMDETMRRHYPFGYLNCGLAHGIPGVLGLLSLAHLSGVAAPGLCEAIISVVRWLADNRSDDEWGINWPNAVPLARIESPGGTLRLRPAPAASAPFGPSRSAWCYGPPGVARAMWLAGAALDETQYRDLAVAAMEAVYRRPIPRRQIDSPTFCHGVAGLLQVTLRFRHDTGLAIFTDAARALSEQLLSLHDSNRALGYCTLEPDGRRVDQPGLLDGAPGVAMVLLASATGVEPTWDRLFLLS